MKTSELKRKSKSELQKSLLELREKKRNLRFDLVSGKVKNIREIRETKKEIARILTIIRQQNNNF